MEQITNTLHNVAEGFTVQSEVEIFPVYYDGELANKAAFTAFRFKRFALAAGQFTTEAARNTAHAATRAAELTGQYLHYMANYNG
jgi:hypothetical protein